MPRPAATPALLDSLRGLIAPPYPWGVLPVGAAEIDAHLQGGLALGQAHEIGEQDIGQETGALSAAFAALLLGHLNSTLPILWASPVEDLYAPGLLAYGLDPGRLVLVHTHDDAETLMVLEVALRAGGLAAVLGEVDRLGRTAARRLHLACAHHGTTCFILRRLPYGRNVRRPGDVMAASMATRWRLGPAPSQAELREPGLPRWQLELLHARGGVEGSWIVEIEEAGDDRPAHPLRVVARLGDDTAAPLRRSAAG